ncbi:unnamed protein product [Polarella glacialis]|uniref:Uncharacterized protein n=1 Tax=Polarella glacialis TaxID=89957 RepID=A0A813GNF4_POLGL|nr:unnamed protein product [Polarella glacialis]CAE8626614.1 unnamed protein product [Polarella glacialis]
MYLILVYADVNWAYLIFPLRKHCCLLHFNHSLNNIVETIPGAKRSCTSHRCMAESRLSCWSALVGSTRHKDSNSGLCAGCREECSDSNDERQMRPNAKGGYVLELPDQRLDRLLEVLPGGGPSATPRLPGEDFGLVQELGPHVLRDFWAAFAALDLRRFLPAAADGDDRRSQSTTRRDLKVLLEARERCLRATIPFQLAVHLLEQWDAAGRAEEQALVRAAAASMAAEDALRGQGGSSASSPQRRGPEALRKAREASSAAKAAAQWDLLLAVQNLLGRADGETAPAWRDLPQELPRRRESYLKQVRAFMLLAALLRSEGESSIRAGDDPEARQTELQRLVAAQYLVPSEWRSGRRHGLQKLGSQLPK